MTSKHIVCATAMLASLGLLRLPAAHAAGPPAALQESQSGVWRLVPLPNSKIPAAWVINTETGVTYLCGTGATQGKARVACIEASFPPQHAK